MQVLGEGGVVQGTPLKSQSVGPSPALLKLGQLLGAHIEPYLSWKVVRTEETHPQERLRFLPLAFLPLPLSGIFLHREPWTKSPSWCLMSKQRSLQ